MRCPLPLAYALEVLYPRASSFETPFSARIDIVSSLVARYPFRTLTSFMGIQGSFAASMLKRDRSIPRTRPKTSRYHKKKTTRCPKKIHPILWGSKIITCTYLILLATSSQVHRTSVTPENLLTELTCHEMPTLQHKNTLKSYSLEMGPFRHKWGQKKGKRCQNV